MRYARYIALAALVALTGCAKADPQPVIVTKIVDRPVAVSCVPEGYSKRPAYVDSPEALKAAPDAAARLQLLIAGRIQRMARELSNDAVIDGCR